MLDRFFERARQRDPALEADLFEIFRTDAKVGSFAQGMLDPKAYKPYALEETRKFRDYMVNESIQQFRDYYETDDEE